MNPQIIISPTGERLVVLPESDYNDLIEAAEHVSDMASVEAFRRKSAAGEEEFIPAEIVN
jgi:PHD/YefM family antitoxin component YafN of YafNO toxin-antitoxin module